MEFTFRGYDSQRQYTPILPSSSSLNYTYFSDHPINHGSWTARSIVPVDMREAVPIAARFPPSLVQTQPQPLRIRHQNESEMLLHAGESFSSEFAMPLPGRYRRDYGEFESGTEFAIPRPERYRRDYGEFEALPLRRIPPSPKIKEIVRYQPEDVKKGIIMLGKPTNESVSGSKRKAPSSPVAGSNGSCSKKRIQEWRCAVCDISATCERGLTEHLKGKKHLSQVESLKGNNFRGDIGLGISKNPVKNTKGKNIGGDIGLGIIKSPVQKSESKTNSKEVKMIKNEGGRVRQNFKFWCKMCQTGAHDEKVMIDHKKGKKHMKNRKARARKRISNRK